MQGEIHDPNQSERQSKIMKRELFNLVSGISYQVFRIKEKLTERKDSFSNIFAMTIAGSTLILASIAPITVYAIGNAFDSGAFETNIVLNKNHTVIEIESNSSKIVAGESNIQKEERIAREAREATARAEAEKQAQIEAEKASKRVAITANRKYVDPSDFDQIYQRAQAVYGVDWRLLKAVHYVETGGSGSTYKKSYAGATGPMQFLPSTFRAYGVDGNSDGIADISNVEDAIYSAARYLSACGYPNVKKALYGYNPSNAYYNKVLGVASSIGF